MPLLREPSDQELEDHLFGSGAFSFGWFDTASQHFPAHINEVDEEGSAFASYVLDKDRFVDGIMLLAKFDPKRTFDDLIEDMDAVDVDKVIQLAIFGEIRYG